MDRRGGSSEGQCLDPPNGHSRTRESSCREQVRLKTLGNKQSRCMSQVNPPVNRSSGLGSTGPRSLPCAASRLWRTGFGATVGGFDEPAALMEEAVAGLSRLVVVLPKRTSSWLWEKNQLPVSRSGSLSLGLCRRFTVSDSFRWNWGTSGLLAGGVSGGSSTAWARGGPGAFGLCLMVRLPSSAKGMHSLELLLGDEGPFRPPPSSSSLSDLSP